MTEPMIRLANVRKAYLEGSAENLVLEGVDLDVEAGEFVAVLGSSGSGKSTLLNLIGGLDAEYDGDVSVDGASLKGLDDRALSCFRRETVGFVFQSFHLIPELSTLDNVALPSWFDPEPTSCKTPSRERAIEVLRAVGLEDRLHRRPDHLSGGERQRVAIARALYGRPRVLLCDEPTGNLDSVTGQEVIDLFRRLNDDGITLLMVTHEARVADAAGRLLRLDDGRLVELTKRDEASGVSSGQTTDEAGA